MILSVIIVNFNVKYFLEQCLCSVRQAIAHSALLSGKTEVIIVDNASEDGTVDFLKPLYPGFRFIVNPQNDGFAKANNLALASCAGTYVLFLNPDTLLPEDGLDRCVRFLQDHPDAGALGVRMIDGGGSFLRESKRGFPGPRASFFKMSGLTTLFPDSRFFAAYYAGSLDPKTDHPVDILSGAFLMTGRSVLDKTGGFDERFFMYAEDIDLSWRIRLAGFRNYYLGSVRVIHFKGESTRRDSLYLKQFYLAIKQFMKKYFHGSAPGMLYFLNFGVAARQGLERVLLPFRKKAGSPKKPGSLFIEGAPPGPDDLRNKLEQAGYRISASRTEADAILYCGSSTLSLKSIIGELDGSPKPLACLIHGPGTHGAVGSFSGAGKGMVISW